MASYQVSPGLLIKEQDFTLIPTGVSVDVGAIVGDFQWGPVNTITIVSSEPDLVSKFGPPVDRNAKDWFCAKNFLSYSQALRVVRVADFTNQPICNAVNITGALKNGQTNAVVNSVQVANYDDFENQLPNLTLVTNGTTPLQFIARYPGTYGNQISVSFADAVAFPTWPYANLFNYAPSAANHQLAFVTLLNGEVVEAFTLSLVEGTFDQNGQPNYIDIVLNQQSNYIYCITSNLVSYTAGVPNPLSSGSTPLVLSGGLDHNTGTSLDSPLIGGWALIAAAEDLDVSYLISGGADPTVGMSIINDVAEVRMDCIAFISPQQSDVVGNSTPSTSMVNSKNTSMNVATSRAFYDGNYKYQYDQYNQKYRWVPLNGDIAGLMARTAVNQDPWVSPAGYSRGQIKNVVKLAFNPSKAQRDDMYPNGINPVISVPGQGVILFGDRTMYGQASAFSDIGVRMLFNVLEKSISTAAKYQLFEFNSPFTRAQFKQMVEPFLRDVQARGGLQLSPSGKDGFYVQCDETLNTPEVIDSKTFLARILLRPSRSINFIELTFAATSTGVEFDELLATNPPA